MKDLAIDLREMVESWESLSPSSPSVTSPGSSGARPAIAAGAGGRGRSFAMAAAILIGLGGLGFGVYAFLHRADGRGGAASTNLQDIKLSILMSRPDLSQEETGVMALSTDGRYLAYVVAKDASSSVVVRQVRTGSEVTVVADSESPARSVAFSRDGDFLYFRNRDHDAPNYSALYQVPSLGGTPRKVLFDVDSAPSFSPDGKQVAFRRGLLDIAGDSVQIADLATGATRELLRIKNPEQFSTDPDWAPDGRTVLIALESPVGGFKTRLQAIDVATGKSASIPGRDWIKVTSARFMPDGKAILASILDISSGAYQLFRIGFPGGETLRLTNDFDGYGDLSVAADGGSAAAVRNVKINNVWVADGRKKWEARPITFANGSSGAVQQSTALPGGAVAFSAPEGNIVRLFRMKADGSDRRSLNTDGVFIFKTVYAQRFGTLFDQVDAGERINAHIWRVDPDGSGLKQLTDGTGEEIVATGPDGASFLFTKWEALQSLYSLKAGETEPHLISDRSVGNSPSISNDGTKVMHVTIEPVGDRLMQRVHVAPIEGGADLAAFNLPPGAVNPMFARDDDADVTYLDGSNRYNLMRMRMPAGKPLPITRITEGVLTNFRSSHAHQSIAYVQAVGSTERLFIMKAGEWKPTLVTEFKTGHVENLSWAPDEPILYFTYGTSSIDVVLVSGLL
jgi:Tol biopolymer transport system component